MVSELGQLPRAAAYTQYQTDRERIHRNYCTKPNQFFSGFTPEHRDAMAGVLQGEKQLFEKFWKGTFKAVAMPRPESIIVASITARRAVTK